MINNTIPTAIQLASISANLSWADLHGHKYWKAAIHKHGFVFANDFDAQLLNERPDFLQDIILERVVYTDANGQDFDKWKFTGSVWVK